MGKKKVDTSKGPSLKSIRSAKRRARGFQSVALSTRKGRRSSKRSTVARSIGGHLLDPGEERTLSPNGFMYRAGGANHYHKA